MEEERKSSLRVPCVSLREPFCSLLLNGWKKLETRKWPVLAGVAGPLAIHRAFHEWDDAPAAESFIREQLGPQAAAQAMLPPHGTPKSAVVGLVLSVGATRRVWGGTDSAQPPRETEKSVERMPGVILSGDDELGDWQEIEDARAPVGKGAGGVGSRAFVELLRAELPRAMAERKGEEGRTAKKARLQEIGDCAGEERVCWLEPCEGSEKAGGAHRESIRQEDLERQSLLRNLDGRCDSCANRKARSSATLSARRACCDVVAIILLHAHAREHTYKHTLNQRNVALS